MNHDSMTLFGARGQIPSILPLQSFHPSPPPPSTLLLSRKTGQSALPEADREPGGGTKLLSLSQQQLMQELQRQQIGFSNRLLSSTQIAARPVLALPLSNTSRCGASFQTFSPPGHRHTQTDFLGNCASMSDRIYPVLSEQSVCSPQRKWEKKAKVQQTTRRVFRFLLVV